MPQKLAYLRNQTKLFNDLFRNYQKRLAPVMTVCKHCIIPWSTIKFDNLAANTTNFTIELYEKFESQMFELQVMLMYLKLLLIDQQREEAQFVFSSMLIWTDDRYTLTYFLWVFYLGKYANKETF